PSMPASSSPIFISHSSLDRPLVDREICAPIAATGVEPWVSDMAIERASDWERSIRVGLEHSDWFLVALTPNAVRSIWVKAEVDWAFEHRVGRLIPVLLLQCDWKPLHLLLRTVQLVNLVDNPEAGR